MQSRFFQFALSIFLLLGARMPVNAQAEENPSVIVKNNFLYGEVGGVSRLASLNYERKLFRLGFGHFSLRAGVGFGLSQYSAPLFGFNYFIGTTNHYLEAGMVGSRVVQIPGVFFNDRVGTFYSLSPNLGYRYILGTGFILRLNVTPLIQVLDPNGAAREHYRLTVAASMGWQF